MKSSTVLYLLKEAIEITNKLAEADIKDLATAERAFLRDIHSLTGYLRAVEAVIKHEEVSQELHDDENEDHQEYEVKKVSKRLKFWGRKPNQINSKILCCFLNIWHNEQISPVPLSLLKQRYVDERFTWDNVNHHQAEKEFITNFGLMKVIAASMRFSDRGNQEQNELGLEG